MNFRNKWRQDDVAHSSALNDILFILLFFFLIISTLANPNLVKVQVPKASSDSKDKQSIVVTVDSTRQFFIGTKKIDATSLRDELLAKVDTTNAYEQTVVINGDVNANWGSVFSIIREAKKLNLKTVVAVDKE